MSRYAITWAYRNISHTTIGATAFHFKTK